MYFQQRRALRARLDGQCDVTVRSVCGGDLFDDVQLANVRDVRRRHLRRLELYFLHRLPRGQLVRGRLRLLRHVRGQLLL